MKTNEKTTGTIMELEAGTEVVKEVTVDNTASYYYYAGVINKMFKENSNISVGFSEIKIMGV